ncbi:NAD-dependent epimerase/dehydratase family protein [Ureibacillus manganicus]|uniref:NAD-dependent epimerase n=1 Tax=Ureibacillus manganicus DSM 26584 TaxID=1384049 RepID=A0A0A3INJ3_9BACL|nr:NAD-dependent epimerase/dehydratase family protein [Ureibacillus manganicus]KGR76407.1 NAD-dependent epimerase [Ureibacillus manganicus DSM 26584]
MKKVLITGSTSFVGTSLKNLLSNYPDQYSIETLGLRDELWKEKDFSKYDVVYHAVGIAHIKETKENQDLYYKVNRDLAYEVAKKAKSNGVKQFIFISSMSVYGIDNGVIDNYSPLKPKNSYGKSKLQAENLISTLENESFKVVILRPPMIYGKGCKGNYLRLANLALKVPFFPDIENKRSMIYIENLSFFVKDIIDNLKSGLFYPQNVEYVKTSEMVVLIAKVNGNKVRLTKLFNPLILFFKKNDTINKVFGDLVYEKNLSDSRKIEQVSFEDSIKFTEIK